MSFFSFGGVCHPHLSALKGGAVQVCEYILMGVTFLMTRVELCEIRAKSLRVKSCVKSLCLKSPDGRTDRQTDGLDLRDVFNDQGPV